LSRIDDANLSATKTAAKTMSAGTTATLGVAHATTASATNPTLAMKPISRARLAT